MSAARVRRAAVAVILVFVAAAIALPVLPGTPGMLRVGGVSLLWWYGAVAAPLFATLMTLGALLIRSE